MKLNLEQVKARIPHRPPILLVDGVENFSAGKFIETFRHFPQNDPAFEGHFPGYSILPGVFGLEFMAQSSALLVNLTEEKMADETLFLFMQVEKARFRKPIEPGATVKGKVEMLASKRGIYKFRGSIILNDEIAQTGEFSAKLVLK